MIPSDRVVDSFKYLNPASQAIITSLIAHAPKESVPWAPLRRPLRDATVALVSTAGISPGDQRAFDTEGERRNPWWGDPSYRLIPRTATERDIVVSHLHIETAHILKDLNVALPLARLAELQRVGFIGRSAPSHYSFMGYLLDPGEFLTSAVPAMIDGMHREGVDAAVFIPV